MHDPAIKKIGQGRMLHGVHENFFPPVSALKTFQTGERELFCVSHLGFVGMSADEWRLKIGGMVQHRLELGWDDLARFPRHRVLAAHECAGSPLRPTVPVRRVGNVIWEGVALASVLAQAGVLPEARYMWSSGADAGVFNEVAHSSYQKDLPIQKALAPEILLATHLNGEPLAAVHGGPVRLVVPGFYGTNSTKWLNEIEFQAQRCPGYFTTTLYNDTILTDNGVLKKPVWAIAPHSLIVSHEDGATCEAKAQTLAGWAWAGGGVAQVEVSTDGGATWQTAHLDSRVDFSWQAFRLDWTPAPGNHSIVCRAMGVDGAVQPAQGARNEWHRVRVNISQ